MVDYSKFSQDSLAILTKAHNLSKNLGCDSIEPQLVVMALFENNNKLITVRFQKIGQDADAFKADITNSLTNLNRTYSPNPDMSVDTLSMLDIASNLSEKMGEQYVLPKHILAALLRSPGNVGNVCHNRNLDTLSTLNVFIKDYPEDDQSVVTLADEDEFSREVSNDGLSSLLEYGVDLTELAQRGEINDAIGRDEEISECLIALSRKTKNNPILVGEPGTGKTAIAEGLAYRIIRGEVPTSLRNLRIFSIEVSSLIAGASHQGEFEQRLKDIIEEAKGNKNVVLFVDEMHLLMGAGSGVLNAANILKPALARAAIKFMGATTLDEYAKYVESDEAFERRMQPVRVDEPTEEEATQILLGLKFKFEQFHHLAIEDEAIKAAVSYSSRYITNRRLPDKAIDVLDQAAATIKCYPHTSNIAVSRNDILQVIYEKTGIPVSDLNMDERERLAHLEDYLHRTIVGQYQAVTTVANAIRRNRLGLGDPSKPIATFLFVGTTGVGKTELCKALAEYLFNRRDAIIRIDMSEYQQEHNVSRLIGAPPGYVGYDEGGQLTEAVRRNPFSVVLFDELEKAHPKVFQTLLQVLDEGRLTDGKGRVVNFKNTIIIMTSNMGAHTGYQNLNTVITPATIEHAREDIISNIKEHVAPEFINRIDKTVMFLPLSKKEIKDIVNLQLGSLKQKLAANGTTIAYDDDVVNFVTDIGYQPEYGARPVKRVINEFIVEALSRELLLNHITKDEVITIYRNNNSLAFRN